MARSARAAPLGDPGTAHRPGPSAPAVVEATSRAGWHLPPGLHYQAALLFLSAALPAGACSRLLDQSDLGCGTIADLQTQLSRERLAREGQAALLSAQVTSLNKQVEAMNAQLKVCTDYHAADGQHALKVEEAQSDITVVDVAEGAGCEDQLVNKMSRLLQG